MFFLRLILFFIYKHIQADTISKRLMSNYGKITSLSHLNEVIFKEKVSSSLSLKFLSLFPGLGYAAGYKILQRIYKYSGQPIVNIVLVK